VTADEIILWIFLGCVPPVNLYAVFYTLRPWAITAQGRALWVKAMGNVIVIDTAVAFFLFGEYPGRDFIRVVGMSMFMAGMWYLLLALLFSPGADRYAPWSWFRRRKARQS
jgi:hypothetical protein